MLVFGPVPSRRLGRSLGINNIPAKNCSYSCIYCQLGKTLRKVVERKAFYAPEEILKEVEDKIGVLGRKNIDYVTFVPDGEPTLDMNLGKEILSLKRFGIPVAVISNSSLIWCESVKEDLKKADLVSFKVDAVGEKVWRKINRPQASLRLSKILEGLIKFSEAFNGKIITETMLVEGIEYDQEFKSVAEFLARLGRLNKAYIAVPTRPPAESWVKPLSEKTLNMAFQTFSKKLGEDRVEYLIDYEGTSFAFTGNFKEDLLSITAVHPMREDAVIEFLKKAKVGESVLEELLNEGKILIVEYHGHKYYIRRLEHML